MKTPVCVSFQGVPLARDDEESRSASKKLRARSPMHGEVTALLIFHRAKPYRDMEAALRKLAIPTKRAQTLAEASHVFSKLNPPLLAFTESKLPDGNWADVVSLSERASSPVGVIVVGQEIDTKLYASAIEVGASDFVAPPFDALDLAHVVRCAADKALARRGVAANSQPFAERLFPDVVKSQGSA